MNTKRKGLEFILKMHKGGKVESNLVPLVHHKIEEYKKQGFCEVIRTEQYIRLDRGNDFLLYDLNNSVVVLEYFHNGDKR